MEMEEMYQQMIDDTDEDEWETGDELDDDNENILGEPVKKPMKPQLFASDSEFESDDENNLKLHLNETSHVSESEDGSDNPVEFEDSTCANKDKTSL